MNAGRIFLIGLFLLLACVAKSQSLEKTPFVYAITSLSQDGKAEFHQTGFKVMGIKGILTTLHGVLNHKSITAESAQGGDYSNLAISMVDINNDLALLTSKDFDGKSGFQLNKAHLVKPKQVLTAVGYPTEIELNLRTVFAGAPSYEKLEKIIPAPASGLFSQRNSPFAQIEILYLEASLVPGHSGSPLINANNEVVGVVDGGLLGGKAGISWAIPIEYMNLSLFISNKSRLRDLSKLNSTDLFAEESTTVIDSLKYPPPPYRI